MYIWFNYTTTFLFTFNKFEVLESNFEPQHPDFMQIADRTLLLQGHNSHAITNLLCLLILFPKSSVLPAEQKTPRSVIHTELNEKGCG